MSKEIEALEQLKMQVGNIHYFDFSKGYPNQTTIELRDSELFTTIEKALKDYELMKQTKIIVIDKNISDDDLEKLKNQRIFASSLEESKVELLFDEETQKKLKALEIIKEKGIILQFIKETYTVEQYNAGVFGTLVKPLTQEEYDLLKEIFDE